MSEERIFRLSSERVAVERRHPGGRELVSGPGDERFGAVERALGRTFRRAVERKEGMG